MDWATADPLAEIDGAIDRLEDDRDAWQHQLEEAHLARVRAEHLADSARVQERCAREHVRGDTAELAVLREERRAIVPDPRQPL